MSFITVAVVVVFLCKYSGATLCQVCWQQGTECQSFESCEGKYCLLERYYTNDGQLSVRRSCSEQPFYVFDDNYYTYKKDSCVTRKTKSGIYCVKICSSNYCNSECNLVPSPLIPRVTCCSAQGDGECRTVCQGRYCFYEANLSTNSVEMGCFDKIPENNPVNKFGDCEVGITGTSKILRKICDNENFCNQDCVPSDPPDIIQKDPLVTCNCDDCLSNSCTGRFCTYRRQIGKGNVPTTVQRGCSSNNSLQYPDGSLSILVNSCEYRTINDIPYEVLVCNKGNNCNIGCPSDTPPITCECDTEDQLGCERGLCQGLYCKYQSFGPYIEKSCVTTDFPDGISHVGVGICKIETKKNVNHEYKLCQTDLCNSSCKNSTVPFTTPRTPHTKTASVTLLHSVLLLSLPTVLHFANSGLNFIDL